LDVKFNVKRRRGKVNPNIDLEHLLEKFLDSKRLSNRSEKTIKTYRQSIGKFIEWLTANDRKLEPDSITEYIRYLKFEKERWDDHPTSPKAGVGISPRTINNIVRNIKVFCNYLYKGRIIPQVPTADVSFQKEAEDTFEVFSDEDVMRLLSAPNQRVYTGFRDYVMMLVLIDAGLRISEMTGIKLDDIDFTLRQIHIRAENVKTRVGRIVPISAKTAKEIDRLNEMTAADQDDYVFMTQFGERYYADTFAKMLKKYGKKAGLTGVRVSPHTFRNYMAIKYLKNGGDPFSLMRILGHTNMSMTNRYIKYSDVDISSFHEVASPVRSLLDKGNSRKRGTKRFK
jgi:integrase/recombinase XerD